MNTYHSESPSSFDPKSKVFDPIQVENLGQLLEIDDGVIAGILLERSKKGHCYTRIGEETVIYTNRGHPQAVEDVVKQYVRQAQDKNVETRPNLPPHSVELATNAYRHLVRDQVSQSIFLTGDRLSSPSFTRTGIVRTLVQMAKKSKKKNKIESRATKMEGLINLFTQVESVNGSSAPASSLYSEFAFSELGDLEGIYYEMLYLDTSRVQLLLPKVSGGLKSSFHVFYALLAGASSMERGLYQIGDFVSTYKDLLTQEDTERFEEAKQQFKALGIGRRQQVLLFKLLSSIMHLQHVKFSPPHGANLNEACTLSEDKHSSAVCDFFGVSHTFLESSLTTRVQFTSRDDPSCVSVFLTVEEAEARCVAIAAMLYERLVAWVFAYVNNQFSKSESKLSVTVFDFHFLETKGALQVGHGGIVESYIASRGVQWMQYLFHELCESVFTAEGIRIPIPDKADDIESPFMTAMDKSSKHSLFPQLRSYAYRNADPLRESLINGKIPMCHLMEHDCLEIDTPFAKVQASLKDLMTWNRCDLERDLELLFTKETCFNPFFSDLMSNSPVKSASLTKTAAVTSDHGFKLSALKHQMDRLFERNALHRLWRVFHLPGSASEPELNAVVKRFQLSFWTEKAKWVPFAPYPFALDQFCAEFKDIMTRQHATDNDKRTRVLSFIQMLGLSTNDLFLGQQDIVFVSEKFYRYLTDNSTKLAGADSDDFSPTITSSSSGPGVTDLGTGKTTLEMAQSEAPVADYYQASNWETESVATSRYDDETSVYQYSVDENFNHSRDTTLANNYGKGEPGTDWMMEDQFKPEEAKAGDKEQVSSLRKKWVCCTWFATWWIPSVFIKWCGGLKRSDMRMAWREKVTLCLLIFLLCCLLLFIIIGIPLILCPPDNVKTASELSASKYRTLSNPYVILNGNYLKIVPIVNSHIGTYVDYNYYFTDPDNGVLGTDVSGMFYAFTNDATFQKKCPGLANPAAGWDNIADRNNDQIRYLHAQSNKDYLGYLNQFAKGYVGWTKTDVKSLGSNQRKLVIIYDNVYDFSQYTASTVEFLGPNFKNLIVNNIGKDATPTFESLKAKEGSKNATAYMQCVNSLFYVGTVDHSGDAQCVAANYILLVMSIIIVSVIGFKFIAALQFASRRQPEDHDKFVICQVPCYTEGAESLTKTLESLAVLRYDDKRKLIVVICDGMIIGSGNDRPTPRIVLDILGVDPTIDPEPLSFLSIGEGSSQHNMAKVFSGLYETQGHTVPFLAIIKVGKPSERNKPGNRGKRDSQLILMRFLSKVHFNQPMTPLELEMYHQTKNVIGVSPVFYEYVLMVDADTEVSNDALNRMVSCMIHDSKVMGLCGETRLANERQSWVTMIQVYEYFISHHLSKAFESLFGSVTCLPGCFCMYRVRSPVKNAPLLVSPAVVDEYSICNVKTLHMKNLLSLGEDRYLTTLMLKHYPDHKLKFTQDATCRTNAPDRFSVLLSQRRRWINSTIHNLFELLFLGQLCGFCCCSMRFVVFLELFATVTQPATIMYIAFLIYTATSDNYVFPLISIIMIAAIYGFQIIIFLLKRQWQHIGWMLIYILALPFYSIYLPLYSFWHFDDFSWGNTRMVAGKHNGKTKYVSDAEPFDPSEIPTKKWADYETELWESWEKNSNASSVHSRAHSMASSGSHRPASVVSTTMSNARPASVVSYKSPTVSRPGSVVSYNRPASMASFATGSPTSPFTQYSTNPPPMGTVSSAPAVSALASPVALASRQSYSNSSQSPIMAPFHQQSTYTSNSSTSGPFSTIKGSFPSDQELLFELKRMLATADLMTLTKKKVRLELSEMFQCDLTPKREFINQCVDAILQNRL